MLYTSDDVIVWNEVGPTVEDNTTCRRRVRSECEPVFVGLMALFGES